jgi:uncharacterized protein YndB with AHSA1/START domain
MPKENITVSTTVAVPRKEAWHYYTEAEHVINWNFPGENWHCPSANNDLRVGGGFNITMAEKSGQMEVELEGTYDEIETEKFVAYTLDTGRTVRVDFADRGKKTELTVTFDPDPRHGRDHERDQWQSILNNYRTYAEAQPN